MTYFDPDAPSRSGFWQVVLSNQPWMVAALEENVRVVDVASNG
ncbi:MAG: hypothetical protein LBI99_10190 [Propionibacteriaceae bacterium]|nr:hypothetical protein [Propionibacteriaceae bacterium]